MIGSRYRIGVERYGAFIGTPHYELGVRWKGWAIGIRSNDVMRAIYFGPFYVVWNKAGVI